MNSRRSVSFELLGIALATAVFVATFRERPQYVDLVLAVVGVVLIVATTPRSRRLWESIAGPQPLVAREHGWQHAVRPSLIFTGCALIVLAALGASGLLAYDPLSSASDRFGNWHIVVAALLYFPWALLQQFIFQLYLLGRLLQLLPVPWSIAITALGFASVHFPRWPVMVATLGAGAFWSFLYYRHRALLPLAISHAVLGSALHYWVFGNDLLSAWLP
jgi:membrane protease YdiL (CAAX protease family)